MLFLGRVRTVDRSCVVIARVPGLMVRMWCGHMLYLGPADSRAERKSSRRGSVRRVSYSVTCDGLIYTEGGKSKEIETWIQKVQTEERVNRKRVRKKKGREIERKKVGFFRGEARKGY